MSQPPHSGDAQTLMEQADAAFTRGDVVGARDLLERATAADDASFTLWMRLASVQRAARDPVAALVAVERALAIQPLDFVALLLRAHLFEQAGSAEAGEIYGYALAQAPGDRAGLAPAVARMLDHARVVSDGFVAARDALLREAMAGAEAAAGDAEQRRLARFRGNVLRHTRVFHSDPTDYFYPGLVEREFHDPEIFPWLADLNAAAPTIRAELDALLRDDQAELAPYVQYAAHLPMRQWAELNHSRDWTAIHLLLRGSRVEANAARCPATVAFLATLPQPDMPGYGPNAMFSMLAPGAHIPPHTGVANTRLVCHLPLVVPPGCWFRVGTERREWREGEAFVFDDTIEHEAANESAAPRIVLIFDLWHPGLSDVEREGVSALLRAGGRTGRVSEGAL